MIVAAITRRQVAAPATRFFKPRLHPQQVLHLHLLHELLLGDLLSGQATEHTLWEWMAMGFTWSRTAQLLGEGEPEIAEQLDLAKRLVHRLGTTGSVVLADDELEAARRCTVVMDLLAQRTDSATATAASHWSEGCLSVLRSDVAATGRSTRADDS